MKDLGDITACVVDRGTFFPVAQRLAKDFKKVYYHNPTGEAFDKVRYGFLGVGHPNVERQKSLLSNFWDIDLYVFPDCQDADDQLTLESLGKPVWGTRKAEDLENRRGFFLDYLDKLELPYPETKRIVGLSNLRDYLRDHDGEELWIKLSRWRGDMETWKHVVFERSRQKLDILGMRMGPIGELLTFYVQKPVETDIEAGSDTYSIDGQWPDKVILGYEKKGESYLARVKNRVDMPPEVWKVNELMTQTLRDLRYRNFFSTEVRLKDTETYFLDPCCRCPSPAGEEQLEMYKNFGEIVANGAEGVMVQPEFAAQFCGEAIIQWTGEKEEWRVLKVPEEVRQFIKPYGCTEIDGNWVFPPDPENNVLGCAVGMGDTIEEVIDHLKELREALSEEDVEVLVEPMAALLKEVVEAEEQGIPFAKEIPEPAAVMEE